MAALMPIEMVVAVAENGIIGADGDMPWQLSTDLKRFRDLTMGRPMIMGRKTFESIGKALPGRTSIVVTRNKDWQAQGAVVAKDMKQARDLAQSIAASTNAPGISVIGGSTVFNAMLEVADVIHLTRVHAKPDGDTSFPTLDGKKWQRVHDEPVPAGPKDTSATTYEIWQRGSG